MNEDSNESGSRPPASVTSLGELAGLFFRLGATAFGGPAAHIAMMQDEVVGRRRWLSEERFLDLLGATNLIPGPNSTELAIHIGWERRRWAGLVVSGTAFILPAMLLTGACGWAYRRFGTTPDVHSMLYGVKPVALAVIVQAIWQLAPKAAPTVWLRALGAAVAGLAAIGMNELALLFASGAACLLRSSGTARSNPGWLLVVPFAAGAQPLAGFSLAGLFFVFLKTGSVLFGSGYVLAAFLRADLVERLGWLTEAQLIDAIAVGQITPGPVFTTATFIGYVLSGPAGALVATLGIFLPAFFFVAVSAPLVPKIRASRAAGAFLDGVNVASLALMVVVTAQLGRSALLDLPTLLLAVTSSAVLIRYKPNASWLVLGGAVAGWALGAAGYAR